MGVDAQTPPSDGLAGEGTPWRHSRSGRVLSRWDYSRKNRARRRLGNLGYHHKFYIQLGSDTRAHVDLPAVHMVASQFKRWMLGTVHYGASSDHFGYYLDEFTFRFNRRTANSRGLLFYRLLHQAAHTSPQPLKTRLA